jgi:hypothetical protein
VSPRQPLRKLALVIWRPRSLWGGRFGIAVSNAEFWNVE